MLSCGCIFRNLHLVKKGGKLGRAESTAKTKISGKTTAGGTAVFTRGVNSSDATSTVGRRVVWREVKRDKRGKEQHEEREKR
jgi:hypothetical protein